MKRMHLWADGVYRDRPEPGVAQAQFLSVTRLDSDGRPVPGTTVYLRGPVSVDFRPDEAAE